MGLLLSVRFLLLGSVVSGCLALLPGGESWKVLGGCLAELRIKKRHKEKLSLWRRPLSNSVNLLCFNLTSLS